MARGVKIIDEYTDRKDLTKSQKFRLRHPELKEKARENTRQARLRNPERYRELSRVAMREKKLKSFGLDRNSYNELVLKQEDLCAICRKPNTSKRSWRIDHNHSTGKVRGLLCNSCNLMLGHAFENIETLIKAIEYLKYYNE